MRVYHFLSADYGLQDLRNRRLKIARINELNDPFEFLAPRSEKANLRSALRNVKRELAKDKGILCFSSNWQNPLMWSHYADRHKGICLGFDIPLHLVTKVTYVSHRMKWPSKVNEAFARQLCMTKFSHWSYEEELRAFVRLDHREQEGGNYFMSFSEDLALRCVVVGAESDVSRDEIDAAIDGLHDVERIKARAAFRMFKVVKQRSPNVWK